MQALLCLLYPQDKEDHCINPNVRPAAPPAPMAPQEVEVTLQRDLAELQPLLDQHAARGRGSSSSSRPAVVPLRIVVTAAGPLTVSRPLVITTPHTTISAAALLNISCSLTGGNTTAFHIRASGVALSGMTVSYCYNTAVVVEPPIMDYTPEQALLMPSALPSAVLLTDMVFYNNTGCNGGALHAAHASVVAQRVRFDSNWGGVLDECAGGAVYAKHAHVWFEGCQFESNGW